VDRGGERVWAHLAWGGVQTGWGGRGLPVRQRGVGEGKTDGTYRLGPRRPRGEGDGGVRHPQWWWLRSGLYGCRCHCPSWICSEAFSSSCGCLLATLGIGLHRKSRSSIVGSVFPLRLNQHTDVALHPATCTIQPSRCFAGTKMPARRSYLVPSDKKNVSLFFPFISLPLAHPQATPLHATPTLPEPPSPFTAKGIREPVHTWLCSSPSRPH
jgi:hypothetical protein